MPHLHHADLRSSESVLFTLILVFTALVYLRGWLSLRSGALKGTSAWRALSFLFGVLLIWAALASPIAALDHELLTVHMLQHLLLMTLAPPLIWLGAPVGPTLEGLPQRFVESLARLWQSGEGKTFADFVGSPKFAWLAACAALVGWHIPKLFALGMQSTSWHLFEQLSFLATGLLFWWPVVQPSAGASRQDLSMILYLFFATLPCDILSGFLVFSERVVYPMYFSSSHLLGFSPLVDQQCAAALMWTCVTVVYLIAGAILTMHLLSPRSLSVGLVEPKCRATEFGHRVSQSLGAI
ncbi:MAG TPA: cytochrome c oxidase assembly protein [Candidatus Sulfotelmatobacter sp.]|nr:cytochrome c oxidase assembly protein [Candidatus Sulfotelmatobacter sp.]